MLLRQSLLLRKWQQGEHSVERGRNGLLNLGCNKHDGGSESKEIGDGLALGEDSLEIAISNVASQVEGLLLVFLPLVEVLNDRDELFALVVSKSGVNSLVASEVVADGVVLCQHLRVAALRVLCGELAAGLRVSEDNVDVMEVHLGDSLLEELQPAIAHNLLGTGVKANFCHIV